MKIGKILFLLCLALALCLLLLPTQAEAAVVDSGTCGDNLTWTLDDAGTLTISGTGPMWNWSGTKSPWYFNTSIRNIVIKNSVRTIGDYAFRRCVNLQAVTIGNNVDTIGQFAFYDCGNLESVTIGNGLTVIGSGAFSYCDCLVNIYYAGTKEKWCEVEGGITRGTIHFNHIHDYTLISPFTMEATCKEQGYIEYTCVYGDVYREILPIIEHKLGEDAQVITPTCTDQGYTISTCPDCGGNFEMDYVAALGHDFAGKIKEVAPTCTEEGYTGHGCIRCEAVEKTDKVDALGHNMVLAPAVAPTCTETGLTAGTKCDRCDYIGVAQKEVPVIPHSFENGICTVCDAPERAAGDLDDNEGVTTDDVVTLLLYISMPDMFSLPEGVSADFTGDGQVTTDDVVKLLLHISMPDMFPLEGEITEPEDTETSEPTEPPTPEYITEPEVGKAYKFMLTQKNLGKNLYITGTMDAYYYRTTENVEESADVYFEEASGGYYLYIKKDGVKNYLEIVLNGTRKNVVFVSTPTKVLKWNADIASVTCDIDGVDYYFGTYNTYKTFSAADISRVTGENADAFDITNFVAHFYKTGDEIPSDPAEPSAPIEPTEPEAEVLIISDTQTISNRIIDSDVYITSTGRVTFYNVTVNGDIYCYGQLVMSGCVVNDIYAYAYGSMFTCSAFDGVHGKVSGGVSCNKLTVLDNALDYAFQKWGKK